MVPERAVRREDCAGKPGLRGHVATCCIRLHDAAGAARSHVGVDKREVGCKGEEGVDPPGVAPVDWRVYADCQPRLPIPVFRNLFVGLKKTFLPGFLRISFIPVFRRNFSQEREFGEVTGIPFFFDFTGFFCRNSYGTGIPVFTPHHLPARICGLFCGNKNYSRHERILQGLHRNW